MVEVENNMDNFSLALLTRDEDNPQNTWNHEKYFLNRNTGEMFITFNKDETPTGKWWVQISQECYQKLEK